MPKQPNIEGEPYNGVQSLFSGDLHAVDPSWAPRNHWYIISPGDIRFVDESLIIEENVNGLTPVEFPEGNIKNFLIDYFEIDS